jgi:hypothetical protein
MAEYPEHEKLQALNGANQTVGDFLEWLGEHALIIAEYGNGSQLFPCAKGRNQLIAEHFEIDQRRLDQEKKQMLDQLRAKSAA